MIVCSRVFRGWRSSPIACFWLWISKIGRWRLWSIKISWGKCWWRGQNQERRWGMGRNRRRSKVRRSYKKRRRRWRGQWGKKILQANLYKKNLQARRIQSQKLSHLPLRTKPNKNSSSRTRFPFSANKWAPGTSNRPNSRPHPNNSPNRTFQACVRTSSFPLPTWVTQSLPNPSQSSTSRPHVSISSYSCWNCFVWWIYCVCMGWWGTGRGRRIIIRGRGNDWMDYFTYFSFLLFDFK